MAETIAPNPEINEADSGLVEVESRFGDKSHFREVLTEGEGKILGSLDDLRDIDPHMNIAQLAEITNHLIADHEGSVRPVFFGYEAGEPLLGVFKPHGGESDWLREEFPGIDRYDVREALAYDLSEHFGFDLVPPTIQREIDGQVGSLQLYVPETTHQTLDRMWMTAKPEDLADSIDYEVMAAFDYIIANHDRHKRNILVRYEEDGARKRLFKDEYGAQMIAIDNGTSMSSKDYYGRNAAITGPSAELTYDFEEKHPIQVEIPPYLISMLKTGLENSSGFDAQKYSAHFNPNEIEGMWERAQKLLQSGVFLSRYNEKFVLGQ